jgi:hypothetical protein
MVTPLIAVGLMLLGLGLCFLAQLAVFLFYKHPEYLEIFMKSKKP